MIRIRPPLPRELENSTTLESIHKVSSDGKAMTITEYLGAEVEEGSRIRDLEANPQLVQYHTCTFDYVFDQQSTQQFV